MKKVVYFLFCSCILSTSFCQTSLSGVINSYARVISIEPCSGLIIVDDTVGFKSGDQILLIQMKGAQINESNSNNFGTVTEIGGAGFYEKNEIESISGFEIQTKFLINDQFNPAGAVQLISFPKYDQATVDSTVTALPWDGEKGGVVAFEVAGNLEFQSSIEVSGLGFRGGLPKTHSSDCSFLTNANDYHYDMDNWRGAPKGEGIAEVIVNKEQGRGAQANGGGGGNDHNAGGGGGANISNGGVGGKQSVAGFGCDGEYAGVGGKGLVNESHRLFLGGGGGAGHDNNGVATAGGNGGGIIIILAQTIIGNNQKITSNGENAGTSNGDGAGGGGAGGTILIEAAALSGSLNIEANGGNGGDANNPSERCIGVGGGGSGGKVATNLIGATTLLTPGQAGVNLNNSSQCNGPSNGAANGQAGIQEISTGLSMASEVVLDLSIGLQSDSASICVGESVAFAIEAIGNNLSYQWQINDGTGWADVQESPEFTGVSTQELFVSGLDFSSNGHQFRCVITDGCGNELFSNPALLTIVPNAVASFTFNDLGNGVIQFVNNSVGAGNFLWDFGDGGTSTDTSPEYHYLTDGSFTVSLIAMNACGENQFLDTVFIGGFPEADFSAESVSGCVPFKIQFNNSSTGAADLNYWWEFEGGQPAVSAEAAPAVSYSTAGIFDVKLIVENALGIDTLLIEDFISAFPVPVPDFSFNINGPVVQFSNASQDGEFWFWDFGDGSSSFDFNPIHAFPGTGDFSVTLTASNSICAATLTQQITITSPTNLDEEFFNKIALTPNPVASLLFLQIGEESAEPLQLQLFDLFGRRLINRKMTARDRSIDLIDLANGIYNVEIEFRGQKRYYQIGKM